VLLMAAAAFVLPASWAARAQSVSPVLRLVRVIEADDIGAAGLPGLPFPPGTDVRLVFDEPAVGAASIVLPDAEDPGGLPRLTMEIPDPINLAFAGQAHGSFQLLLLDATRQELVRVTDRGDHVLGKWPRVQVFDASAYDVDDPRGMTIDPGSGQIFILDAPGQRIVRVDGGRISEIAVPRGLAGLRGIAINPADGHLHLLSPSAGEHYELDGAGGFLTLRALPAAAPLDLRAMTFAPSTDRTDDPSQTNLFLVGASGGETTVTEWSLTAIPTRNRPTASEPAQLVQSFGAASSSSDAASLVQDIDASAFDPPSPDSAGIAYQQPFDSLLMADSEVNEMPLYEGVNIFELTRSGAVFGTFDTTDFSDEPTGVAINPANGHCFFSDDAGDKAIYEVDPGSDGLCLTGNDAVTEFSTEDFGSDDPEGIAFGQGMLFIVDGVNRELYTISPGANGIFEGSSSDDQISNCDTASLGVDDPEGVTFDSASGTLFVVGQPATDVAQITTACDLVRVIDISAANAEKPAGLTLAPGSVDPAVTSLWVTDRGVDNDPQPDENDGRIYELSLPFSTPGNLPPVVSAGPDLNITLGDGALLQGTVIDDGLPSPASLTSTWSRVSGPGAASFADPAQEVTSVSFSAAGTYLLRLTGKDGELQATDDVTVTVAPGDGSAIFETRVWVSSDDAEEGPQGGVGRGSSDLELVDNQTVGIRFSGVAVPRWATILAAHVQFQVDENGSDATSLTLEGEAVDHAAPFLEVIGDISSRPRTAASASWNPVAWPTVGEAGPDQQTSDLSAVIQEIVNRPGWSSGNALAIVITGIGLRTAEAFDGSEAGAPLLHVRYLEDINTPPGVTLTAPADGSSAAQGAPVTFAGTATDAEDGDLTTNLSWVSDLDTRSRPRSRTAVACPAAIRSRSRSTPTRRRP
jgi:hypothetical protein